MNRRLSHKSGLFPEDEAEITGLLDDNPVRIDENSMNPDVLELIREQCAAVIYSTCSSLVRAASKYPTNHPSQTSPINMLEFTDTNQVALLALEQGRIAKVCVIFYKIFFKLNYIFINNNLRFFFFFLLCHIVGRWNEQSLAS